MRQRRVRADAQRNIEVLLETAARDFSLIGVDVPMREIAAKAGVGVGTLYRHFPSRSDLVVAVYQKDIDGYAEIAQAFADSHPSGQALSLWVESYVEFIATHQGLAAALNSGDPSLQGLPAYFLAHLSKPVQDLLDAAAEARSIRTGIKSYEVIHAVAMLCVPPQCGKPTDPQRMVGLFMDGLRFGVMES